MRIARVRTIARLIVWAMALAACLHGTAPQVQAVVVSDDPNLHVVTPPSAYDGVAYLSTVDGSSGVLIDSWYLLTAKHAVFGWSGNTATFHLASGTRVFALAEVFTCPTADLAVVRLNRDTGLEGYPLYDPNVYGSEIGQVGIVAGYGMSGLSSTVQAGGDPNYPRGTLRVGYNMIDTIDPNYTTHGRCLRMDFDSPTSGGPYGSLGADKEVLAALGDSGGPVFLNAGGQLRVAGIHVAVAPNDPNHWPKYGDNSYHVCVSSYASWISSVVAGTPAPYTGDFNNDGLVNATDIDSLRAHYGSADLWYDVSGDGIVGRADTDTLVRTLLGTQYGDANLDRSINGGDLSLMAGAWMKTGQGWGTCDFNGDGSVDGGDLAILGGYWNWSAPSPSAPWQGTSPNRRPWSCCWAGDACCGVAPAAAAAAPKIPAPPRGLTRALRSRLPAPSATHVRKHLRGHERRDVSTHLRDLLDETGGREGELRAGHDEHGLHAGDLAVRQGRLKLKVQIGGVPDAPQDSRGADLAGEVHRQPGVRLHPDVPQTRDDVAKDRHPPAAGQQAGLFGVLAHGDHQLVEQPRAAPNDVQVAAGDGVEGPGEDRQSLGGLAHGGRLS